MQKINWREFGTAYHQACGLLPQGCSCAAPALRSTRGIELIDIRIKRIGYVEAVQQRVFDRMVAERQRIAEQFRSEGQGRAAEIDGDTERSLQEIQSEANRQAEVIRGQADAEATRIYSEAFGADPEFYAFLRTLESYPNTIDESSTLILGTDSEYFRYLRDVSVQNGDSE